MIELFFPNQADKLKENQDKPTEKKESNSRD